MPKAKTIGVPLSERSEFLDKAYSDEFLSDLGAQFDFDALGEQMASEIRMIGRHYLIELSAFDGEMRAEQRKRYQRLKMQVLRFQQFLSDPELDIENNMYWAAWRTGEPAPQTDFPQLSEFEKTRGAPYWAELKRLLLLLDQAADHNVERFAPLRGRKRNEALEDFVQRCAFIWEHMLGRRFSLDHHHGIALTEAGQFVTVMINRFDPLIREQSIITAMRNYIAWINELDPKRSRAS